MMKTALAGLAVLASLALGVSAREPELNTGDLKAVLEGMRQASGSPAQPGVTPRSAPTPAAACHVLLPAVSSIAKGSRVELRDQGGAVLRLELRSSGGGFVDQFGGAWSVAGGLADPYGLAARLSGITVEPRQQGYLVGLSQDTPQGCRGEQSFVRLLGGEREFQGAQSLVEREGKIRARIGPTAQPNCEPNCKG